MEIVPGVHAIDRLGAGRVYLYQEADPSTSLRASRLTLIDTGLAGSAERIFAAIERLGRRPEELRQVVITHYHRDHTGALADVVERTGAQVLVHALDAPVVRGERPPAPPNPTGAWRLLRPLLARGDATAKPVRVDRELTDGDEIELDGGARVVHAPGHTPGSIAIYVASRRLLFAGDAAANAFGVGPPSGPFGLFNEDRTQLRASFRKLAELDFEVACFGHGPPLQRDACLAFRRAAERLA